MSRYKIRLNERGLAEIARSAGMARVIEGAGEAVASNARAQGILVEGDPGDIGLPVDVIMANGAEVATAVVSIVHPSGDAVQAKHGTLTKAAAEAGLDVQAG